MLTYLVFEKAVTTAITLTVSYFKYQIIFSNFDNTIKNFYIWVEIQKNIVLSIVIVNCFIHNKILLDLMIKIYSSYPQLITYPYVFLKCIFFTFFRFKASKKLKLKNWSINSFKGSCSLKVPKTLMFLL